MSQLMSIVTSHVIYVGTAVRSFVHFEVTTKRLERDIVFFAHKRLSPGKCAKKYFPTEGNAARNLPLVLLLVCWAVASCEASLSTGGLVGGLAILKGAALVSYAVGRHQRYNRGRSHYHGGYNGRRHYRYGRSVDPDTEEDADEGKNLLLSTVGQLDPDGCILKMLCHLQTRSHSSLTPEENLLVDMFSNNTENMASYNAAFVYAMNVGTKTHDPSVCNGLFPKCSLREEQLSGLLRRVWGCASDLFRDDAEHDEDFSATPPIEQPMGEERPVDEEPRQEQQTLDEDELPLNDKMSMEELVALIME
ncbi:uncharacterized protein LOC119586423 [Penaeus monodon]|uniref:uncharacterized protein LOC119586423 n=1 Tax=Penaeus monodon TaxID=6687 RepID=UPI0018A79C80|nr:uncharacterized protein LOC119586423 [Penaeus monodon]